MLNCLIVEDEPLAAGILEDYIRLTPFLRLTGKCGDAFYALEALHEAPVDLLFLDIHLPGLKGLDLLRTLLHPPQVILTTAYHEYALESYDLGVVDYLLKPIDFERFLKAVQKVRDKKAERLPAPEVRPFQFFNVNKKMVRVWVDEILCVESLKDYLKIYLTQDRQVVTKGQINDLEARLAEFGLVRLHRSFLVGAKHIEAFTATDITIGKLNIPIGRQYKEAVSGVFGRYES
jgi:DNA-binding LytR/AlgR family response regulator